MIRILLLKNLRDLRAALAQTIALIVIIALGIASFVSSIAAYRDLGTSYNHTYRQLDFADVTFSVDAAPPGVLDRLTRIKGVAAVTGRLVVDVALDPPAQAAAVKGEKIRARLIGLPRDQQPQVNNVMITQGRYFSPQDDQVALIESHFAQIYHVAPGSTLTPVINGHKEPVQVVGVAASPEYLVVSASRQDIIPSARTFAVLFVPLPVVQQWMGMADSVNDIAVRFTPDADQDQVIAAIKDELKPYDLITTTLQKDQPSSAALKLDLDGYREIGYTMPMLILFVAAAALYVMLGRLIHAQQTQIGLMMALGYRRRAIVVHYLMLALVVGVFGSVIGIAAGIPLGREITAEYANELGIPLVQSRFYLDLVVQGVLTSLVVAFIAGLVPALNASRLEPVVAMRPTPAVSLVKGGKSLIEHLLHLPLWLRVPLRNVWRVRSRSISTSLGVVFAFVLVLAGWSMMDSMTYAIQNTFQHTERWDLLVIFDPSRTQAAVERMASWPGVEQAEPIVQLPATIKGNSLDEDISISALSPSDSLHRLQMAGGITPKQALQDGHIVLTTALADKLKLRVGDTVTLETPAAPGKHTKTVRTLTLGGTTDEMMSAVGYISLDESQQWLHSAERVYNGVYLKVNPAQVPAIRAALFDRMDATLVQVKSSIQNDWQSLMGFFYAFVGIIVTFALAMAFALLFNTMTVNVLEQQREYATMRAMGTGRRLIALFMTTENVIVWIVTLIPGLVLGTWTAQAMMAAFQSDLFTFTIVILPLTYVVTSLGILLTLVLAALPAIWRVNRLNLAESTRVLT
jgi:putative ABC transport system permease protein